MKKIDKLLGFLLAATRLHFTVHHVAWGFDVTGSRPTFLNNEKRAVPKGTASFFLNIK